MRLFIKYTQHIIRQLGWKSVFLFVSILLGVFILMISLFPFNMQRHIDVVESQIESLYQDDDRLRLKTDLTKFEIQKTIRRANQLSGNTRDELYPQAILAQEKWQATEQLKEIYQTPQSDEITPAVFVFLPNLTEETIRRYTESINWTIEDKGTELIDTLLANTSKHWERIESLNATLEDLYKDYTISREKIPEVIQTIGFVSQELNVVKHHPQTGNLMDKYQSFLQEFVTVLEASHRNNPFSEEVLNPLLQSEYAVSLIEDSVLDVRPKVALTFDDGPNEEFTPQVLDILKENDIQATFFVVGRYVELYPEVAKRIVEEGHIIANHSYDHPDFSTIGDSQIRQQIYHTQEIIESVTSVTPTMYRMPYGSGGERVYRLFPNLTSVTWNTDTGDWYLRDASAIYENIMSQLSDDMLVLLHDTNQDSVDVLEKMIATLSENYYHFVSPLDLEFDSRY